jgi:hypothetical protein
MLAGAAARLSEECIHDDYVLVATTYINFAKKAIANWSVLLDIGSPTWSSESQLSA